MLFYRNKYNERRHNWRNMWLRCTARSHRFFDTGYSTQTEVIYNLSKITQFIIGTLSEIHTMNNPIIYCRFKKSVLFRNAMNHAYR